MSLNPYNRTIDGINELELAMSQFPEKRVELPITHRLLPGLYLREIRIPADTILTSMEHMTEHPFIISAGVVKVVDNDGEAVVLTAPHTGITRPGTRRALHTLTDVVWTTIHPNPTNDTDIERICRRLIKNPSNPLIDPDSIRPEWMRSLPQPK